MYLFSRQMRLGNGRSREAIEWALGQTEKVHTITGLDVGLFTQVFSPSVGTLAWSTFVPDLATLEAAGDKLNVDDAFIAASDKAAALTIGSPVDRLAQILHGEPDPNRSIEYVTVVRTVCASGRIARGLELGVEIAARAEKITGTPTLFLSDVTGSYGGVSWTSGHADVRAMEEAQGAFAEDAGWVKYIDKEVSGVYSDDPSTTTSLVYRRLA